MTTDLIIPLVMLVGGTITAIWANRRDREAAAPLHDRIDKLEKLVLALRHYIATLVSWGTRTTDDPPRDPPDPPNQLMGGD